MQVEKVTQFGGPEVLVASPEADPVAGHGEAVIGVVAADVLWVETMIRRGEGGDYFDVTPPYVPGNGVAGRVTVVGQGVDPDWIGRAVVITRVSAVAMPNRLWLPRRRCRLSRRDWVSPQQRLCCTTGR